MARAAGAIVLIALCVIGFDRARRGQDDFPLLDYQRPFTELDSASQREYRELREAILEIERLRSDEKAWPEADRLRDDGIPPFAQDGVDGKTRTWRRIQDRLTTFYAGVPLENGARPLLLIRLLESAPGDGEAANPDVRLDEEHHRLADGTLLHVTVWCAGDRRSIAPDAGFRPEFDGFTQWIAAPRSRRPTTTTKK